VRQGASQDAARPLVPLEQDRDRDVRAEQVARNLDQEARAVAALPVGVQAAAVCEP
jgi:hypothetical protein